MTIHEWEKLLARAPTQARELAWLMAEYRQLIESWEYAFAMGHGCSNGTHPEFRTTVERAMDLWCQIQELT